MNIVCPKIQVTTCAWNNTWLGTWGLFQPVKTKSHHSVMCKVSTVVPWRWLNSSLPTDPWAKVILCCARRTNQSLYTTQLCNIKTWNICLLFIFYDEIVSACALYNAIRNRKWHDLYTFIILPRTRSCDLFHDLCQGHIPYCSVFLI